MAKNLMPELAKMLGVEMGKPFYIHQNGKHKCIYSDNDLYKITEEGLANINNTDGCYEYHTCWRVILTDLLLGECSVEKLPWEPKDDEVYWTIIFGGHKKPRIGSRYWIADHLDFISLRLGLVYRTQEEAEAHLAEDYERLTGEKLKGKQEGEK